jgi:hypothetical protein
MFKEDAEDLWQLVMSHKGSNFAIIAEMPDSMNLN